MRVIAAARLRGCEAQAAAAAAADGGAAAAAAAAAGARPRRRQLSVCSFPEAFSQRNLVIVAR